MKIAIALDTGFYGGRRVRKGEKFSVADDAKAKWFTLLEAEAKPTKQAKASDNKVGGGGGAQAEDLA